jgi:hypothetical protein
MNVSVQYIQLLIQTPSIVIQSLDNIVFDGDVCINIMQLFVLI